MCLNWWGYMFKNYSLKSKLIAAFVMVGVIPVLLVAAINLWISAAELEGEAFQKLIAVQDVKKSSVESYFNTIGDQISVWSQSRAVIDAAKELVPAFAAVEEEEHLSKDAFDKQRSELKAFYNGQFQARYKELNDGTEVDVSSLFDSLDTTSILLQHSYIQANPNELGSKHKLEKGKDGTSYSESHAKYHATFTRLVEKFGYYDVFIVDPKSGKVVYSVYKELDFATSLKDGPYADSGIGHAFEHAMSIKTPGEFSFDDFSLYAPSYNAPASFVASPVFENNTVIAVLIFQMPVSKVVSLVAGKAGLGETGESYLVGPDLLMRSNLLHDVENRSLEASFKHPETGTLDNESVRAALKGERGQAITENYYGGDSLSVYSPINVFGERWAFVTETSVAEANKARDHMLVIAVIFLVITAGIVAVIGYFVAVKIGNRIVSMTTAMSTLAAGDTDLEIPGQEETDEIGDMATAIQIFKENALKNKALELEQEQMRAEAEEKRLAEEKAQEERVKEREVEKKQAEEDTAQELRNLVTSFENSVGFVVDGVASAATEMESTAQNMTSISERTSLNANSVASASGETSNSVQSVASATEELSASIQEISQQVSQSSNVTTQAVADAEKANELIEGLDIGTQDIGEVVSLIQDIAEQTNLLALNATIEAARAGDAGKGFAVVASEVKNLASQTAKATEQISSQISNLQSMTGDAVSSVKNIAKTIRDVDAIASAIASAVEEQGAATQEISSSVQKAAAGTQEVSTSIQAVTDAANESNDASQDVLTASKELSKQAEHLREQVASFVDNVKTG